MSIYPIYIDSTTSGAQLSIGTVNTSYVVIGAPTTSLKNTSSVINGVRLDSNKNLSNIIITYANSSITPINGTDNTVISDGLSFNRGSANTAFGSGALFSNIDGSYNTAIGYQALNKNTTQTWPSVAVGYQALGNYNNPAGGANVAVGYQAGNSLTTGPGNVAIGYLADSGNKVLGGTFIGNTGGTSNVVIGNQANCQGTSACVVIGNTANTSSVASNCVVIGSSATSNFTNCVVLGTNAVSTAANQIMIGTTAQTTQIGNTRITNSTNFGTIYVSTNWKNNVQTAPTAYQGDSIFTTGDSYDSSIGTGSTAYARPLIINGADITFNPTPSYPQNIGRAGDVYIRGGGASSNGNNGTAYQSLIGGNVYIDGGGGYCQGGDGNSVAVTQGSIYLRTGAQKSGNTYYGNSQQTTLMTVASTGITAAVGMVIDGTISTSLTGYYFYQIGASNPNKATWANYAGTLSLGMSLKCAGNIVCPEYNCNSDIRLKKIIKKIEIDDGLKFMKNEEILFEWKSAPGSVQSGYKAQEVIKSGFGHLVTIVENKECTEEIDEDGFISPAGIQFVMNYNAVIPYHGVVIKHLVKENEELKKEQKLQQDKITSLETKLQLLESQMATILQRLDIN
jgi:hypothetical protein